MATGAVALGSGRWPRRSGRGLRRRPVAWCAGALLAGVSLPLAFRAAGCDGITPVPQLLAFLPWLAVPAGLALLLAFAARWRTGCAWAAGALLVTAAFIRPYGAEPPAAHGPAVATLRVLSANLEFGRATGGLLEVLRRERPDLVSLQECDPVRCAAAVGSAEVRAAYPYRISAGDGAAQGSAILSRHPLVPDGEVAGELAMPRAQVTVRGHRLRFQVAHPMPPLPGTLDTWRAELGRLRGLAARHDGRPLVIAGDFNASQDHAAFRALLDTGLRDSARAVGSARTPSWPAGTAPPLGAQIDHVLAGDALRPCAARFLDLPDTDHRALLVRLTLYAGH
ncbi:endonuclease/exonuclease/phosphatase family protein [Streptomyces sp. MST-110588]|uniref:endonuclease/exonuclease/phosphatase family protein n=1 Tax=Streptomyces sp. MST-110588 TaxID=2833628 RepID=UPI001F5D75D4|nr:endonuclease/exonuclease/phosphatase family protein [Streptomyces sp. MST-110588]UNO39363.1 endonuclease/exonuclease/phosphatase family protein [Streptomyces sp. MST-110588]